MFILALISYFSFRYCSESRSSYCSVYTCCVSTSAMCFEKMTVSAFVVLALFAAITLAAEDNTVGPVFVREPPNRVDFSNTTGADVACSARGNPPPEIIWVRSDGTAVGDVPGLRQVLSNGNLVFPPFRAEDYRQEVHAQVYACLAKNSVGSILSRDVNVRAGLRTFY